MNNDWHKKSKRSEKPHEATNCVFRRPLITITLRLTDWSYCYPPFSSFFSTWLCEWIKCSIPLITVGTTTAAPATTVPATTSSPATTGSFHSRNPCCLVSWVTVTILNTFWQILIKLFSVHFSAFFISGRDESCDQSLQLLQITNTLSCFHSLSDHYALDGRVLLVSLWSTLCLSNIDGLRNLNFICDSFYSRYDNSCSNYNSACNDQQSCYHRYISFATGWCFVRLITLHENLTDINHHRTPWVVFGENKNSCCCFADSRSNCSHWNRNDSWSIIESCQLLVHSGLSHSATLCEVCDFLKSLSSRWHESHLSQLFVFALKCYMRYSHVWLKVQFQRLYTKKPQTPSIRTWTTESQLHPSISDSTQFRVFLMSIFWVRLTHSKERGEYEWIETNATTVW